MCNSFLVSYLAVGKAYAISGDGKSEMADLVSSESSEDVSGPFVSGCF